jgi:hypothetical protein
MWAIGTKRICRDVLYSTAIGPELTWARAVRSIVLTLSEMNIGLLPMDWHDLETLRQNPSFKAEGVTPLRPHVVVRHRRDSCGSGQDMRTVFDELLRTLIGRRD